MQQMSSGVSIIQNSWPHTANVAVHVVFASIALVLGFIQLVRAKGDARHLRYGRAFLRCITVAVITAAVGVVIFSSSAVLGITTLLVGYWAFSGYRALQIRTTGPGLQDALG